jgi:hypothetical protein
MNWPIISAIFFSPWKTTMAAYDLEEQEQLDELKTWWKMYGNLVTGILVVLALAVVGWQGWNWWQRQQSAQASALYSGVQTAVLQKDAKRARELAGELIDKYSSTAYAGMGALLAAPRSGRCRRPEDGPCAVGLGGRECQGSRSARPGSSASGIDVARRKILRRSHSATCRRTGCLVRASLR